MPQVSKASEISVAAAESLPVSSRPGLYRWGVLAAGLAAFVVWFGLWPYQHWNFENKVSVLGGWFKILQLDANVEWQFCYVVPLICGFLVYRQRKAFASTPVSGSWWGLPVLAFAGLCYWLGYKVDTGYLGYASLQLSVAGFILLLGGVQWMKLLFVPWVFLVFAWPLFPLDYLLAAKLKIPTAWLAEKILSVSGVGVVREGSMLQSAADFAAGIKQGQKFTLDVADSCSGMRSLYALIMVAVLYSFMALNRTIPRILLSLSAIPLAVIGNVVRLILLSVACLLVGQEWAVGKQIDGKQVDSFFHLLAGFMVFGVALSGMFALASQLEGRHWKKFHFTGAQGDRSKSAALTHQAPPSKVGLTIIAAFVVVACAIAACYATPSQPHLRNAQFAPELPEWVGGYHGQLQEMSYLERVNFDPTVTLVRRRYTAAGARPVTATIVISGEQKRTLHTPEVCMPNQGWAVSAIQPVKLKLKDGRHVSAGVMRMFRDVEVAPGQKVRITAMNLNWYQGSNGFSTPGYNLSHFMNYSDAILFNYNHRWSQASFYMEVNTTEVGKDDPLGEIVAMQELVDFASEVTSSFLLPPDK